MDILRIEYKQSNFFDYGGYIELDNGRYTFQDSFCVLHGSIAFERHYSEKDYKKICKAIRGHNHLTDNVNGVNVIFENAITKAIEKYHNFHKR